MGAGPLSEEGVVKAAETLVAVYVDCTKEGQNGDLQEKYGIEGYPTLLFVTFDEEKIEEIYPEDGPTLAKRIGEIVAKHSRRPWVTPWEEALKRGKEQKRPVVVVLPRNKEYDKWDALGRVIRSVLKDDFEKYVFGYALPESEGWKKLESRLPQKSRVETFVALDPLDEDPFQAPLADPGEIRQNEIAGWSKRVLKIWQEKREAEEKKP